MKKVLLTATEDSHINHFHLPYLKFFKEKGFETHVATNSEESIEYCDIKHKISIERSPFSVNNIRAIKELKKIVDSENFNLIHTHTPMGSVVTRFAAKKSRKKGTKIIYTAHGFHFYKGAPKINWLVYYPVEKLMAKFTDDIVTINLEDYNFAKNKFESSNTKVHYIPGVGIEKEKIDKVLLDEQKYKLREELGIKNEDYVLIFPARLDKNKNQKLLIEVMYKLIKLENNVHLLLPGRDELNGEYQKYTKDLGLENNIHFLGFRTDISELLSISDIAVSSSLREGLPVNIMEALAKGLPIVALNCRGMDDIVKDNENGYLVRFDSNDIVEDFYDKTMKLIDSKNLRDDFSKKNIEKSQEYYFENIIEKYTNIYFNE